VSIKPHRGEWVNGSYADTGNCNEAPGSRDADPYPLPRAGDALSLTMMQLPFISLGLYPEATFNLLLPRVIDYPRAMEWLLLGNPFHAEQALD